MEYKYDRESVQELLEWAKSILESKSYPAGPLQMNVSAKILDCKFYFEALHGVVKPRPAQRKKISEALHKLGAELMTVKL